MTSPVTWGSSLPHPTNCPQALGYRPFSALISQGHLGDLDRLSCFSPFPPLLTNCIPEQLWLLGNLGPGLGAGFQNWRLGR